MEFSRQECWSGLPFPTSDDLPDPGIKLASLCLLLWQVESLPTEPPGKPKDMCSVQLLSHVWLFTTLWTAEYQGSLSITNSWSLLKLMSIKSVMPSNHLILSCPLLLLPSIFPSIRVFSKESVLSIRWPNYWSFNFSISPSNEYPQDWFPLGWTGFISFQSNGLSKVFSNITVQKQQFFGSQLAL